MGYIVRRLLYTYVPATTQSRDDSQESVNLQRNLNSRCTYNLRPYQHCQLLGARYLSFCSFSKFTSKLKTRIITLRHYLSREGN